MIVFLRDGAEASSGAKSAPDQPTLILTQTVRQRVQFEPLGAIDFKTLRNGGSFRGAAKDYLHLPVFLKRANEGDARDFDLKADLFTQLAADGLFGLVARPKKPAGNAPAAARTKTVMKKKYSIARINHHRAYGHGEA